MFDVWCIFQYVEVHDVSHVTNESHDDNDEPRFRDFDGFPEETTFKATQSDEDGGFDKNVRLDDWISTFIFIFILIRMLI